MNTAAVYPIGSLLLLTWKAGSKAGVDPAKIVGVLPESDPRRALILEG